MTATDTRLPPRAPRTATSSSLPWRRPPRPWTPPSTPPWSDSSLPPRQPNGKFLWKLLADFQVHVNFYLRGNSSKTPAELLKIFRYPPESQRELARAAEGQNDSPSFSYYSWSLAYTPTLIPFLDSALWIKDVCTEGGGGLPKSGL